MILNNQFRLLLLKIAASIASLFAAGCQPNWQVQPTPQPVTPENPTAHTLTIKVDDGRIKIDNAEVKITNTSQLDQPRVVTACDCGCNHSSQTDCDADCPRRAMSRPTSPSSASAQGSSPQIVTQTKRIYDCRNGVCGWYDVPIVSSTRLPVGSAETNGRITVYVQRGNPASDAMQRALRDVNGIYLVTGTPPAINGLHWWPTAVDSRGRLWSPTSGWKQDSVSEFERWREGK